MNSDEQLFLQEKLKEERKTSNETYALKIVERIVFIAVGLITTAFIAYLTAKVWPH